MHLAAGAAALPVVTFQPFQRAAAQSVPGTREVPARTLPVPDTVSPQMQAIIARPLDPSYNIAPETIAEWKARVDGAARAVVVGLPRLRESLGVTVEPTTVG